MRQLNKKGLDLIKKVEGVVPFVYLCQGGYPTIGCGHRCIDGDFYLYGNTVEQIEYRILKNKELIKVKNFKVPSSINVKELTTISNEDIDDLLFKDVEGAIRDLEHYFKESHLLNDNQYWALISFIYNVGCHAFSESTLLQKLIEGDFDAVPTELNKYTYSKGVELTVLIKRRKLEGELFMSK